MYGEWRTLGGVARLLSAQSQQSTTTMMLYADVFVGGVAESDLGKRMQSVNVASSE